MGDELLLADADADALADADAGVLAGADAGFDAVFFGLGFFVVVAPAEVGSWLGAVWVGLSCPCGLLLTAAGLAGVVISWS